MPLNRTPLRYPGGKQKLWPFISEVIETNGLVGCSYFEPYAGGAGVAIELLLADRVSKVYINDSCPAVYSFWWAILNETDRFCRRISRASLTVEEWRRQREVFRNRSDADRFELGFALFYLNRCNRSGIVTGGVIGGLDQSGRWKIDARFPRNELISRIESIARRRRSIVVSNRDAEDYILNRIPKVSGDKLVYCDPPYFRKAERLYPNHYSESDHSRLARVIQKMRFNWIVSYDACDEIRDLYSARRCFEYSLQYNAATAYKGTELFAFSDRLEIPEESRLRFVDVALPV